MALQTVVTGVVVASLVLVVVLILLKWKRDTSSQTKVRTQSHTWFPGKHHHTKDENSPLSQGIIHSPTQNDKTSSDIEQQSTGDENDEGWQHYESLKTPLEESHNNTMARIPPTAILEQELRKLSNGNQSDDEALVSVDSASDGLGAPSHQDQLDDLASGMACLYEGVDYSDDMLKSSYSLRRKCIKEDKIPGEFQQEWYTTQTAIVLIPLAEEEEESEKVEAAEDACASGSTKKQ
jgi:hypothetical protein